MKAKEKELLIEKAREKIKACETAYDLSKQAILNNLALVDKAKKNLLAEKLKAEELIKTAELNLENAESVLYRSYIDNSDALYELSSAHSEECNIELAMGMSRFYDDE